jgi:DNA polymerase-3 subunit beta
MATATRKRKTTGITLSRADLLHALATVGDAVPKKTPKPILHNVLLHDGMLTGTDLELRIDCDLDYHDDPLLLPHARLTAILKESKVEEVTLVADGTSCMVQIGRSEWKLPVEDAAEFPSWEPTDTKLLPILPVDQFARAVRSVAYACDDESGRFALGAVLFEVSRKEGRCWVVASDGRRLSAATMSLPNTRDVDDAKPLVPHRAMTAIQNVAEMHAKDGSGIDFEMSKTNSELVARFDGQRVIARLVDGQFPRWRDVFPDRDVSDHVVNIDSLLSATRLAAIVTTEESKGVDYDFAESGLTLTARSSESGESHVECEVVKPGQPASVKLDPRFVQDVLKAMKTLDGEPTVRIEAADAGDAVLFRYGEDGEYRSVIMPLAKD